jgi:hypothetical protein
MTVFISHSFENKPEFENQPGVGVAIPKARSDSGKAT